MAKEEVIVIGGGVGGCKVALELAKTKRYKVTLLEKNEQLLSGTSDATPWRVSLGFHYIDPATAKKCLDTAIELLQEYPGMTLFSNDDIPLHRSGDVRVQIAGNTHYYIVNNSIFSEDRILDTFRQIREYYRELVAKDPRKKIFGEPDDLFSELSPDQYQDLVTDDRIKKAIRTAEPTLNWPKLQEAIRDEVAINPDIRVFTGAEVVDAKRAEGEPGYLISYTLENAGRIRTHSLHGDAVVNATYYGIEKINKMVGFEAEQDETRTNRLKALVTVKVPDDVYEYCQSAGAGALFFCFGPHCAMSLTDDGYAKITYEPVTNVEQSTGIELPELSQRYLSGGATADEKRELAEKIIAGVATYIPGMEHAEYVEQLPNDKGPGISFGIVRTRGQADINSPASDIHKRDYPDVRFHGAPGDADAFWVDSPTSKLVRMTVNAKEVVAGLNERFEAKMQVEDKAFARSTHRYLGRPSSHFPAA